MTKRARIIYNPSSGHEAIKRDLLSIMQIYEQAGYETSAFATTPVPFSARDEARRAALENFDLLIAAGGDGTVNEVVNGIASLDHRPMMAVIPSGTTNDYARALGVPRDDLVDAARTILNNETIKMDIGLVNKEAHDQKYFMNIAALGTLSEVTYEVPSVLKSLYGYLAYLVKGAELVTRLNLSQVRVEYDGGEYIGQANLIFIALTNSVGGFEQIVPDAKLDDGMFTLLIVKEANLAQIAMIITKMLKGGQHIESDQIVYVKTKSIKVSPNSENTLKVNLDGEYGGDAPMTFENLRQHIEFVANTSKLSKGALSEEDRQYQEAEKRFLEEAESLE